MSASELLRLENATRLYGQVIGVNDISLALPPGAYGLLGPNGSGKSTLIHLITGQFKPTLGSVHVLGERPWNNASLIRRIGICPQLDTLYSNISGFEWVRYLLEIHGYSRSEATQRTNDSLDHVGMSGAMHREMGTYSRGMRQRTKLAQAFAHDPELLILDEPFNGLDPVGRHEMTVLLRDWIRTGRSVLLASHVLHEVEAITNSFLLILGGRLLASGSAAEVQTLLAEIPNEIRIRSSHAHQLAQRLMQEETVEAVRLDDARQLVTVSTRHPLTVYENLSSWIAGTDIRVREMQSSDGSLQAMFNSLMRIHRGEV